MDRPHILLRRLGQVATTATRFCREARPVLSSSSMRGKKLRPKRTIPDSRPITTANIDF